VSGGRGVGSAETSDSSGVADKLGAAVGAPGGVDAGYVRPITRSARPAGRRAQLYVAVGISAQSSTPRMKTAR